MCGPFCCKKRPDWRTVPGRPGFFRGLCTLALGLFCLSGHGEEAASQPEAGEDGEWLDDGHSYITSRADNLAYWMNDFFGDVRTEEEAPHSTLRLRYEQEWDEENNFDSDIKLRGKVHLPALNRRLSLIFSEEDSGATGTDDLLIDQRDAPDNVALQFEAREKKYYRVDFRVGLRSSLHPKTSVRYRYEYPLLETLIGRFSEEVIYSTDDGFESKTRFELDKVLSENRLLQWHNKVDWEEEVSGVDWASTLSLDRRLSDTRAYAYFIAVNGMTKPSHVVNNYAVGIRYRQQFLRPWLFAEVQPSYRWSKEAAGFPRENAFLILFRLEAVFKRDFGNDARRHREEREPAAGQMEPETTSLMTPSFQPRYRHP